MEITQEESTKWERININNYTGWIADYETEPGYMILTFTMSDKSQVTHKIKQS